MKISDKKSVYILLALLASFWGLVCLLFAAMASKSSPGIHILTNDLITNIFLLPAFIAIFLFGNQSPLITPTIPLISFLIVFPAGILLYNNLKSKQIKPFTSYLLLFGFVFFLLLSLYLVMSGFF